MEPKVEYYSQKGMEREVVELLRSFREDLVDNVMEKVPMYLYECDYEKRTLTTVLRPTPWMADRTGAMSNGALSVALDQSMGILSVYFARGMTPTVTMQMSLLRPIPVGRELYIRSTLLGTDGTKNDLNALVWSQGMEDQPACSAVGIYFIAKEKK